MAGQQEEYDLGLSLGGLYKRNSAGAHRARAVSEENAVAVAAAPRAGRAASLPTEREMELMREGLTEVQALSRVMAASLKLTIQKERTNGAPAVAAWLPGLVSAGGSGRLAATSSTVSGELMSTDGSSNRPAVTSSMIAKENADDPQQDPPRRDRLYNRNVARPIRRYRRNTIMPHVKTISADGKRVEGYLYKYLTGKVRIVCLCHGLFQSPAEFVNHAGGNVAGNPLKQITVSI
ncbi:PREDICTED: ninja-family protein 3-like [Fragaria vesca subsp. vesca]|uniref:ninja-family protein 3-like n=1 Tax=Fragaria vesca subsp. vesca TaxID=101020 RepID=UPI0002C3280F|nr:PREDICTED: ninja-family protein 3-like [Fragaria vesca subsp. vesca]